MKKIFVAFPEFLNYLLTRTDLITLGLDPPEIKPEAITPYYYKLVKNKFSAIGWDIGNCPTNNVGNPEDLVKIDGKLWTRSHLQHCSMIADASRFIPFSNNMIFCSLGEGLGRTMEILGQLYKEATFLLIDIPPQLYVANQYVRKIFPDRVIDYEKAVNLDPKKASIKKKIKGKIVILPPWKMPEWTAVKISIFWNSASFQEMEPDVVVNYLTLVKKMRPNWVYINALPKGNYSRRTVRTHGTRKPVRDSYYIETLRENYDLIQKYETDYFLFNEHYFSYIFRRRSG